VTTFELDPKHHIDRQAEKELFLEMLELADDTRVLAIRDRGGMGKSSLLEWFAYHCRWSDTVKACSLTSLSEHTDHTPFGLVSTIRSDAFEKLPFPRYDTLDHARAESDFRPFRPKGGSGVAVADTVNRGGIVAGTVERAITGDIHTYNEAARAWTAAQESLARRMLVDAFFADIAELTAAHPIVIMLDAFEKCHEPLRSWVRDRLLREHVFGRDERCHGLVVVLAGHELPEIEELPDEVHGKFVRSIESLSKWDREHVQDFLQLYGFEATPDMVDLIQKALGMGLTLVGALGLANEVQPKVHA
jgi:hypothetical protein